MLTLGITPLLRPNSVQPGETLVDTVGNRNNWTTGEFLPLVKIKFSGKIEEGKFKEWVTKQKAQFFSSRDRKQSRMRVSSDPPSFTWPQREKRRVASLLLPTGAQKLSGTVTKKRRTGARIFERRFFLLWYQKNDQNIAWNEQRTRITRKTSLNGINPYFSREIGPGGKINTFFLENNIYWNDCYIENWLQAPFFNSLPLFFCKRIPCSPIAIFLTFPATVIVLIINKGFKMELSIQWSK